MIAMPAATAKGIKNSMTQTGQVSSPSAVIERGLYKHLHAFLKWSSKGTEQFGY
jgi:hypothetical protein